MSEKYKQQLNELAADLVTPERFGRVALAEVFTPVELAQLLLFEEQAA